MTTTTDTPGKGPTGQLEEALHAHFIRPEDRMSPAGAGAIYLTEVTAPDSSRRADAVHIGLWQSRGAGRIDVCEIKTSRSDFLRELADPAKAEAWWPYCTAFWLVVPHISIAGPDDLPHGWGLMVPSGRGRRFKVLVKPQERTPRLTVDLLLTLLKNTETARINDLRQQRAESSRVQYQREQELRRELVSKADPKAAKRLKLLDELEQHLGMPLSDYPWKADSITPQGAAEALKTYAAGAAALHSAQEDLRFRADGLDQLAAELLQNAHALRTAVAATAQHPADTALTAKEA